MSNLHLEPSYLEFIAKIKDRYQSAQLRAAIHVNTEVIQFYWQLGKDIIDKQKSSAWGDKFLEQLSTDLQKEFQGAKGFSVRNLKLMRQFAELYPDSIRQQAVAQLPWGHIAVLMQKVKDKTALEWYAGNTLQNNISRNVIIMQIEQDLYSRQGKNEVKISNFHNTLPQPQSDLALQMLKNPYNLDFLTIGEDAKEKELEKELVKHISQFLTELGVGFAYMGKQYKVSSHGDDYWLDLLFFHVKLNCYAVVELKTTPFEPEYAGKLNFYLSLVDEVLKEPYHNPTIGILLCKEHKKYKAEYALRNIMSPIGVSEYQLIKQLPDKLKTELPSIEEIEAELSNE
jgi:predicted nuclease of restriction endonuclease-like (RecB) superfamily